MIVSRFKTALDAAILVAGLAKLAMIALIASVFVEGGQTFIAQAQDQTCGGTNLLAKLEREDPEAFARVQSQTNENGDTGSVFWKIEKTGVAPSWLYGTMHLSDPRIATLRADLVDALKTVDTVAVESLDAMDPAKSQTAMVQMQQYTLNLEGTPLMDKLPNDLADELEWGLAKAGMPVELADTFQPWLVSTMLAVPACELAFQQSGKPILDQVIAETGRESGKELVSLETLEEQFKAISSIPESYQLASIEAMLRMGPDGVEDQIETMKQLYLNDQMDYLMPLMSEIVPDMANANGAVEFQEILIDKRNKVMLERSLELLENGRALIAVGALHLPGETGLVNLYRKAGYTLTPVR